MHGLGLEEKILNLDNNYGLDDIKLIRDYFEAGYGVIGQNETVAIKELAVSEGVLLDLVYSGRAFYGMMDFLKNRVQFTPSTSPLQNLSMTIQ